MRIALVTSIAVVAVACSSRPSPTLAGENVPIQEAPSEQEAESQQDALEVFGHRFVRALKNENMVAYSQCWLPAGMMPVMIDQAPPDVPRPTPEQLQGFYENALRRDREIANDFPGVIERLKEIRADLSGMELVSITADIEEQQGLEMADDFQLTVRMDEATTIRIRLDDGMLFNGVWYLTDTAVSVSRE